MTFTKIERFYQSVQSPPLLMTGYNRRFFAGCTAGSRRFSHTYHSADRELPDECRDISLSIIGFTLPREAEGILAKLVTSMTSSNFLTDAKVVCVQATAIGPSGKQYARNDNLVATITYTDGSVCALT